MRRVRASITVERQGEKRIKETKGIRGVGAPQGAGLRPGECPQDRKARSQRSRSFTNLPRVERHPQGVRAGPQEGRGCPQAPWDTNRATVHQGERVELPKGLQRGHALTREQLGGAWAAARRREGCASWSTNPTAHAQEHRAPGTQPRIRPAPGTGRGQEGTG